jgi:hypothetical protein
MQKFLSQETRPARRLPVVSATLCEAVAKHIAVATLFSQVIRASEF